MRSWKLEYPTRLVAAVAAVPALAVALAAAPASAQTSPRVLVIFDTSGSMLWDYQDIEACGGDGSQTHPHRLCDNALGSKLYHAKAALSDIVQSAGGTEFGLMRYHQLERGEAGFGGRQLEVGAQYYDANGNEVSTNYDGVTEGCQPADLLVSPSANSAPDVLEWMDGVENYPNNKELRGNGYTPLTHSMASATTEMQRIIAADPENICRPYFVLLLTDGFQQCPDADARDPNVRAAVRAQLEAQARTLRTLNVGGGRFDVRTYVVGFGEGTEFADELDSMARAGGTAINARGDIDLNNGVAYQANDPDALARALQDAIDGAQPRELCDGRDNDCDDRIDEDFGLLGDPCVVGQGLCERRGEIVCAPNGEGTVCSEEPGDPQAEVCDGQDNDCDGQIDEGVTNDCGGCGPLDEVCDGVDNNCDGRVDEGLLNACGSCGANPVEVCNNRDDDCDGAVDEGVQNACGACGDVPSEVCNCLDDDCDRLIDDGLNCPACDCDPREEICDGQDNDCDGEIDDGVVNRCGQCGPEPEETCNGLDDNCNGDVDEFFPEIGQPCGDAGGTCAPGTYVCVGGRLECDGGTEARPEVCDDLDNDCDGQIDDGVRNACNYCGNPRLEVCDNVDNDCDGDADGGMLCRDQDACINGECAPPCVNGECFNNLVCVDGFCVTECRNTDCPDGQVCQDGTCGDPCDGIICPGGTYCSLARCIPTDCYDPNNRCPDGQYCADGTCVPDACAGVTCAANEGCAGGICFRDCRLVNCEAENPEQCANGACTCENGACIPDDGCGRVACPYPQICEAGACIADPCFEVDCGPGHICEAGACIDDPCNSLQCPNGSTCHRGVCREDGTDPGGGGITGADAGFGNNNSGVGSGDANGFLAGDGCACSSSGRFGTGGAFGLLLLGLGGIMRRRSRRTRGEDR
ncbi:MYXO-CTERM sorting domain-containing protein [Myxococcota bacterium]|nr:MYXO-CTERM sorting domain-containing protein [Myxococcota bacterium]